MTPTLEIRLLLREAYVAQFRWHLIEARERIGRAQRLGTEHCANEPWLLTNVRMLLGVLLCTTGAHAELALSSEQWITEARERNDRFALAVLEGSGFGFLRHLMRDDPDTAVRVVSEGYAALPREPVTPAHIGEFVGMMYCERYRGGPGAYEYLHRELPRLSKSLIFRMEFGKSLLLSFSALACFAARCHAGPEAQAKLLEEAERHSRALAKLSTQFSKVASMQLLAECIALAGDLGKARDMFKRTRQHSLYGDENFLLRTSSNYVHGLMSGDDEGRALMQQSLSAYAERGWRDPKRALRMLGPVIDQLETR